MSALRIALEFLLALACVLVLAQGLYLLLFALAARVPARARRMAPAARTAPRVAVLIPAYREDRVILESVRAALAQEYDTARFEVVVAADGLGPETIIRLRQMGATVIPVAPEPPTKAAAMRLALRELPTDAHDAIVILDADNVADPGAVGALIERLDGGIVAVQGLRTAKNFDTPLARLDAVSEAVNNAIFRAGHARLQLSAALIGSGMAFDMAVFRAAMNDARAVGGFDKELELWLLSRGHRIGWAPDAIVLDEKVRHAHAFVQQRRRWLAAQLHYARTALGAIAQWRRVPHGHRLDYLDKVAQLLLVPRALLLPLSVLLGTLAWYTDTATPTVAALPAAVVGIAILVATPPRLLRRSIGALPWLVIGTVLMTIATLRIRGANRRFIHTSHGHS